MLTELGKFLRKLRVEQNEYMRHMADKLGVSVAFLSGIETGKKRMPTSWLERISSIYGLGASAIAQFNDAFAKTESEITLNLAELPDEMRPLTVAFARSLPTFGPEQRKAMEELLAMSKEKK